MSGAQRAEIRGSFHEQMFYLGDNPDLSRRKEIHAVASLLKLYLRELPEPLIPYDFFEVFLTAAKCKSQTYSLYTGSVRVVGNLECHGVQLLSVSGLENQR